MYLAGAGLIVAFAALGKASGENVLAVIMGVTVATVIAIPLGVSRDKLEHTLEFLQSLPVTVSELVTARFAAAALSLLPGAVATGAALGLLPRPAELEFVAGLAAFNVALGFWLLLTLVAWGLTAASAAFDLASMMGWPLAAFVLLAFLVSMAIRLLGPEDLGAALDWFFQQPFAEVAIVVAVGGVMVVTAVVAFGVAHRGFTVYTPRPERPL